MTNSHPYPDHAVIAVAVGLYNFRSANADLPTWEHLPDDHKAHFSKKATAALTALWGASRVDGREQFKELPDKAVLIDAKGQLELIPSVWPEAYPYRVIYWGDNDE